MRIIFMMDNKQRGREQGASARKGKRSSSPGKRSNSKKSIKRPQSSSLKKNGQASLCKTVKWCDMDSSGYAAVMDTLPLGDTYSSHNTNNWMAGTLGSGEYKTTTEYTSWQYMQEVKKTFIRRPSVYQEFVRILSEVRNPNSDKLDIVKRVIMLFDGYPRLIMGFNFFLPKNIVIEVQDDAVIVKFEEANYALATESDDEDDDTPTMRYIRNVKWTYTHHPEVYTKFSKVLSNFHKKNDNEIDTIHKIVALFQDHPDLVLGFNFFLPVGYRILADKRHSYVIQHPCKKGLKPHITPINVEESYVD